MYDESGLEALRARLDALDTQPRKSALAALAVGISDAAQSLGGLSALEFLALQYRQRIATESSGASRELEAELRRAKNHAWRLSVSLGSLQGMPGFLALVADASGSGPCQPGAPQTWLPSLGKAPDGTWVIEDHPALRQELDELSRLLGRLSERVPPSGKGRPGGHLPLESPEGRLIAALLDLLTDAGGARVHVLPIARAIHEWASGESPKGDWGGMIFCKLNKAMAAVRANQPRKGR
ncbi:MAG TPA: hypothetical protein VN436_06460, partial [Holophaga sp.]|nr:hypothetical protein [Holophaga sp.]